MMARGFPSPCRLMRCSEPGESVAVAIRELLARCSAV